MPAIELSHLGDCELNSNKSILNLEALVDALPDEERSIFRRIFHISETNGTLIAPVTMHPWIEKLFGSVDTVASQKIIKVTNMVTLEGALFNELRASRPIQGNGRRPPACLDDPNPWDDPLCNPFAATPKDVFGRVEGKYCITASNIAKYDGLHGIISFRDFDPMNFGMNEIADYIDVGWRWARRAHVADPLAKYFLFIWNCHLKAGASLRHGHAQVMLSHDMHYAKIESLRRAALYYWDKYHSDYFEDLYSAHRSVGCAFEVEGVKIFCSLTPVKDKEVLLISQALDQSLKQQIYQVLNCYRQNLGVAAFNMALITPPLGETEESWHDFPVMVRIVDRGNPDSLSSDIGSMELYASSVIASDPFKVTQCLKEHLTRQQ